jgi:ubiquinone biosynthesis protein UbiJ
MNDTPASLPRLTAALVPILNHLLADAAWARKRLLPFAGQSVGIALGEIPFALTVAADGTFLAAAAETEAAVRIDFPAGTPRRLLEEWIAGEAPRLWREATVSGKVEFAEALNFVFRNLDWDAEADLARLVGDVAAHRLAQLGRALAARLAATRQSALEHLSEHARKHAPFAVPRAALAVFAHDTESLARDLDALSQRVEQLHARQSRNV